MNAPTADLRRLDVNAEARSAQAVLLVFISLLVVYGVIAAGFDAGALSQGIRLIIVQPDILINDYVAKAGLGPAFLNAGLCALIGYATLVRAKVLISGPAIATIFTIAGFALFGTALAPLSSELAFGIGLAAPWSYAAALAVGVAAGFFLGLIARGALDFHRGYKLYNIGFAAGFLGTVIMSTLKAFGLSLAPGGAWGSQGKPAACPRRTLPGALFRRHDDKRHGPGSILVSGLPRHSAVVRPPRERFRQGQRPRGRTLQHGRHGPHSHGLRLRLGGDWNGPVIGGILTVVGFSAFGKHLFNALPPMIGVALMAALRDYGLEAPAS